MPNIFIYYTIVVGIIFYIIQLIHAITYVLCINYIILKTLLILGNCKEICGVMAKNNPDFTAKYYERTNYSRIQDEIIAICSKDLVKKHFD